MDTDAFNKRLASLARSGRVPNLHGVVVRQHGELVAEHYGAGEDFAWGRSLGRVAFGPDTVHDVRSVTKSVVALLYGIALDRGLVPAPDEPLLHSFPEHADLAVDPRRAGRTVEHALTMSLALEWDESGPYTSPANSEIAMELAPDRYRYVLERPVIGEPGQRWSYRGDASAIIGQLIRKGTGQFLPEFARAVLFEPLGIDTFEWMAGADGVASAASGLRLTPRGLARSDSWYSGRAWASSQRPGWRLRPEPRAAPRRRTRRHRGPSAGAVRRTRRVCDPWRQLRPAAGPPPGRRRTTAATAPGCPATLDQPQRTHRAAARRTHRVPGTSAGFPRPLGSSLLRRRVAPSASPAPGGSAPMADPCPRP